MAAEAEAAREARAKVIAAEGEMKSAKALKNAAETIADTPSALQVTGENHNSSTIYGFISIISSPIINEYISPISVFSFDNSVTLFANVKQHFRREELDNCLPIAHGNAVAVCS